MKDEPTDITELRRRVAKANELSGGYDNRGNHVLGAFLTGILQEYDKVVSELGRWKTGDWCDSCDNPQWVRVDGSHNCDNIPNLQYYISDLENQLATKQRECDEWKMMWEDAREALSYYKRALDDIATALGYRTGQTYDMQSLLKKIERLQK